MLIGWRVEPDKAAATWNVAFKCDFLMLKKKHTEKKQSLLAFPKCRFYARCTFILFLYKRFCYGHRFQVKSVLCLLMISITRPLFGTSNEDIFGLTWWQSRHLIKYPSSEHLNNVPPSNPNPLILWVFLAFCKRVYFLFPYKATHALPRAKEKL
jgi:hypothetical protein